MFKCKQAFTMANNMASSDLWEMLYLPILYLPQMALLVVQWVTLCAKWYGTPNCWYRTAYPPIIVRCWHKLCTPVSLPTRGIMVKYSGQFELRKGLLEMEIRGFEQDLIPCVGQLELANVPIGELITDCDIPGLFDGSCNVCASPSTMKKSSFLVWWPVVLAWS